MTKTRVLVDPLAEAKADPLGVKRLRLNPAAMRNAKLGEFEPFPAFPQEVLDCVELEDLEIFGGLGPDAEIPEAIGKLRKLRRLSLGRLGCRTLPDSLGDLENLEELSVYVMEKLTTLPETLERLRGLKRLMAASTGLTRFSPGVASLRSLETLQLDDTRLTTIPVELWNATALKNLELPNGITELPAGVGALQRLERLWLSGGALRSIAGELKHLVSLRSLRLCDTEIGELPEEVGELAALQELRLIGVDIQRLPASTRKLERLTKLCVVGCPLTSLLDRIAELPALVDLDFAETALSVAERREISRLMKLPPNERAASATTRRPATTRSKAKAMRPHAKRLGQIASVNGSLTLVIGDARIMSCWGGVEEYEDDVSDCERAYDVVGQGESALVDVAEGHVLAVALGVGAGVAGVWSVRERIVVVEGEPEDETDPIFIEYVEGEAQPATTTTVLDIASGSIVITSALDTGAEGLSLAVGPRISVSIEPTVNDSWGEGRRLIIEVA